MLKEMCFFVILLSGFLCFIIVKAIDYCKEKEVLF